MESIEIRSHLLLSDFEKYKCSSHLNSLSPTSQLYCQLLFLHQSSVARLTVENEKIVSKLLNFGVVSRHTQVIASYHWLVCPPKGDGHRPFLNYCENPFFTQVLQHDLPFPMFLQSAQFVNLALLFEEQRVLFFADLAVQFPDFILRSQIVFVFGDDFGLAPGLEAAEMYWPAWAFALAGTSNEVFGGIGFLHEAILALSWWRFFLRLDLVGAILGAGH